MNHQESVYAQLSNFKSHDDAAKLFSSILNYDYGAKALSTKRFASSLNDKVNRVQILAGHDDFKILHCQVDNLLWGIERPIINNLLRDYPYSLFLFSDNSNKQWHFINVKFDEDESRRKLFRRIVIGPDERLHTAAQRIAMLEVPDERQTSPLELQQRQDQAFDVEAVTKEFFSSFVTMFHALRDEIEEQNARYADKAGEISQALLDRLMFLYFIQKKGWLNGNKNYLYDAFKKGFQGRPEKNTYYTDVVLRVFQRLATSEPIFKDLGDMPFLNGGLFEIETWEYPLKIRNRMFGKMFKEMFEHYNFTVREDTALDMEVAIDPEMLGKVFENLILTREKDPKIDLRKSTGSYYTPRTIVHFMCQQSLKEYLFENTYYPEGFGLCKEVLPFTNSAYEKTTKQSTLDIPEQDVLKNQFREKIEKLFALSPAAQLPEDELAWLKSSFTVQEADRMKQSVLNCRVCDPAVGSGAFLVGMLHEMIAVVKRFDIVLEGVQEIQRANYDYELKRKLVEHCLYGVDIQEQAVRICELRLWLSLVVDYHGSGIPPLPNLSYRVRRGNSLIDQLFGYNVNLNLKQGTEKAERLKQLIDSIQNDKHAYFYESDLQKKRKAELNILAKQCDLASFYLKLRQDVVVEEFESKYGKGLFGDRKLKKAEEVQQDALKQEIKELDRLLRVAKNTQEKLLAVEKGKLKDTEDTQRLRDTFVWKLDFAEVFRERNGFDVIIANPPYGADIDVDLPVLQGRYPESIKHYGEIYKIFYELALSHLVRDQGTVMYISSNTFLGQPRYRDLREYLLKHEIVMIVNLGEKVFEAVVPVCIFEGKRTASGPHAKTYLFTDLTEENKFKGDFEKLSLEIGGRIDIEQRTDLSFLAKTFVDVKRTLSLEDILEIKDAGIQYHRSGIGLKKRVFCILSG